MPASKPVYKAILFAPDGDWVSDFNSATKEEVWDKVAEMGSRWIFYPLAAVAKGNEHYATEEDWIIESDNGLETLGLKTGKIKTFKRCLASNPEAVEEVLSYA